MFNAIIEISKNSNMKYEFDKDNNCLILDRVLPNSNYFPYNYGFIPNTLAPDNDENGRDDKIICKLTDKCDQEYSHINDIGDIPENHIKKIIYFLKHYKDNDGDKFIEIKSNYNKETALAFIKEYSN